MDTGSGSVKPVDVYARVSRLKRDEKREPSTEGPGRGLPRQAHRTRPAGGQGASRPGPVGVEPERQAQGVG